MLITFEGPDKSGKSSQVERLMSLLEEQEVDAVTFREPGSTPAAEAIRDVIFNHELDPLTEAMQFFAARREFWLNEIVPALDAGKTVILDRFFDSSFAYQHHGRGVPWDTINKLKNMTVGGVKPNFTFVLNVDLETMKERGLSDDRFDQESEEFMHRVIDGYRQIGINSGWCFPVNGRMTEEEVFLEIVKTLEGPLGLDITEFLPPEEEVEEEVIDEAVTDEAPADESTDEVPGVPLDEGEEEEPSE